MSTQLLSPAASIERQPRRAASIRLAAHEVHSFRPRGATRIAVISGTCWITQAGERDDHVVSAGESLTLHGFGLVVIEPLGGSAVVSAE